MRVSDSQWLRFRAEAALWQYVITAFVAGKKRCVNRVWELGSGISAGAHGCFYLHSLLIRFLKCVKCSHIHPSLVALCVIFSHVH